MPDGISPPVRRKSTKGLRNTRLNPVIVAGSIIVSGGIGTAIYLGSTKDVESKTEDLGKFIEEESKKQDFIEDVRGKIYRGDF